MNLPVILRKFFRPQPEPKSQATIALEEFLVKRKEPEIKEVQPTPDPRHPNSVKDRTFKNGKTK